ncbi:unannotated protein [freshwater metagenome]|jgi:predicted RNA binding protein YcfA (HicA-like mRNA interferase family)|uniref:Unannotated protein n=1 Tax=freshwater metagenome TaxID=449393 RepID=A0A6J6G7A8_9ZZZZ|nr:hypothetical protein [Actinomycetota bacterium]
MEKFPAMKSKMVLRVLMREPLNYSILRQRGSHRILVSSHFPRILYSYHDVVELSGSEVRALLMNQIGLSHTAAMEVIQ